MKKIILIFSTMLLALFIMAGCGQNSAKQKELDLKAKELALKEKQLKEKDSLLNLTTTQTPTQTQSPANTQPKSKEEAWPIFWSSFTNALKQKDKAGLLKLAMNASDFDGGAGGETPNDWATRMVSNSEWKTFVADVNKGVVPDTYRHKGGKITNNCALYFEFKNKKWYWAGVLVD